MTRPHFGEVTKWMSIGKTMTKTLTGITASDGITSAFDAANSSMRSITHGSSDSLSGILGSYKPFTLDDEVNYRPTVRQRAVCTP